MIINLMYLENKRLTHEADISILCSHHMIYVFVFKFALVNTISRIRFLGYIMFSMNPCLNNSSSVQGVVYA